jgi:hypothetical protein
MKPGVAADPRKEGAEVHQGYHQVVKQQRNAFGPESIGGEDGKGDPQGQNGKPGDTVKGPKPLKQGTDKKNKRKQRTKEFRYQNFPHKR